MLRLLIFFSAILGELALHAASAPALSVDANAARHPISPYIYGINWYADTGLGSIMHLPLRRWGGDNTTTYNWQLDATNSSADWYFENGPQSDGVSATPAGQNSFQIFHETNLKNGTLSLGTIPLMDWIPKSTTGCSFAVAKYGPQFQTDPYTPNCGDGLLSDGQTPLVSVKHTDPNDTYQPVDEAFAQAWMQSLIATYGTSTHGGVAMWSLDNEPEWWYGTHFDIYQTPATFDDMTARTLKWGQAVKAVDPAALITGPVQAGWSGMLYSRADMASGWSTGPYYQYWDNPTDQKAHGNMYWIPYYLTQMQQFEETHGYRLLDVLDVHGYINPTNLTDTPGDQATETLRMTSTRALWDPNYIVPNTSLQDNTGNQVAPQLIPRMHQWVNQYYPGTQTAITEYMWHNLGSITGAIAQADILGIFGRESLDYGTLWGPPQMTDPGLFAFRIFLNYDGAGNQFGETSVSATSDNPDALSIFAAQRSDTALTILVLNKTYGDITDSVSLANFTSAGTAQVWQYSQANLGAVVRQPTDLAIGNNTINATFPALSMTLFVLPASPSMMSVPQPGITWVKSASSFDDSAISPGEVVAIRGQSLAPAAEQDTQLDSNGSLTTSLGGVRVLFDGVPAPLVYTLPTQIAAIVPYEIAASPATQTIDVQVEYQGNRSGPFPMPVTAALPGLFTNDYSGQGQAAALNQDPSGITRNGPLDSTANPPRQPATRGSYLLLFGTGEGQTNPPGVDGRRAFGPYPKPVLTCLVNIGGIDVVPDYCGATPEYTAGELQVNVHVPMNVPTGDAVPIQLTVGTVTSPAGVTVAVQ